MDSVQSSLALFYATLIEAAGRRGYRQQQVAAAFHYSEPTLSRRKRGLGPQPTWPEVERVIVALEMESDRPLLQSLWQRSVRTAAGLKEERLTEDELLETAVKLHSEERDREALPLLHEARRLYSLAPADARNQAGRTESCLKLSAAYGNLGDFQSGLQYAREALALARGTGSLESCFYARHQYALMLRLANPTLARQAYARFTRLATTYRKAVDQGLFGEDTVARTLRDGARALVHERARWGEMREMQTCALRWADRSQQRRLQQRVHTLLDLAALHILEENVAAAEDALCHAERAVLEAHRLGDEASISQRASAKYGLVHAAFCVLIGERELAIRTANNWLSRKETEANQELQSRARAILAWAEEATPELDPLILLR